MIDGHIHIERGDYTIDWIRQFVDRAVEAGLSEIRLLEHNYMFPEFSPMYKEDCEKSDFINDWFKRKAAFKNYDEYLRLIDKVRQEKFPVKIKFGLEVCYFKEYEDLIVDLTKGRGFDFLLGSMHFVDGFGFDHKAELWEGIDVDKTYQRYFEDSVLLAKSKIFDGIGHPDTIGLFGHKPSFSLTEFYEKLASALADSKMYADQNSGANRRCPDTANLGMDKELIKILHKHNVPIITSSDAHTPSDVGYKIRELQELADL